MIVSVGNESSRHESRIKIYRWYYYFAVTQFLLYFIVPVLIFPGAVVKNIEVISALTLGLPVGLFLLLVSVAGLFLDRKRRGLYIATASVVAIYFSAAIISWSHIERLDFLLR